VIAALSPLKPGGSIQLPPCNAFQRRLIYQTVSEKFPSSVGDTVRPGADGGGGGGGGGEYVVVRWPTEEEKQQREEQAAERARAESEMLPGFRVIVDAMVRSRLPLVGHLCMLDLMFLIHHFLEPLPPLLSEFKAVVAKHFPTVVDTKHLIATLPGAAEKVPDSSLEKAYVSLFKYSPQVSQPSGFDRYRDGVSCAHEAGYDAWLTGCVLLKLASSLSAAPSNPSDMDALAAVFPQGLRAHPTVGPAVNRLYQMTSDIHLVLDGPQPFVSRRNIFVLSAFPATVKTPDILTPLRAAFEGSSVTWKNDTTAFLIIKADQDYELEDIKSAVHFPFPHAISAFVSTMPTPQVPDSNRSSFQDQNAKKRKAGGAGPCSIA
jgi:poly(A)-specific ribonuclease